MVNIFLLAAGLKLNTGKIALIIGINVNSLEVEEKAACFGCNWERLPVNYLGFPLGGKSHLLVGILWWTE